MGGRIVGRPGASFAGMVELAKKLALAVAAFVLLLGALELLARVALGPVSRENFTAVPGSIRMDPQIPGAPYMLRPSGHAVQSFGSDPRGYFDEGATLTYRTNSLGFRGEETTLEKPPGVVRIAGLGDSFTFGTGVRREHTYLAVLERDLNARNGVHRYEVLNLGVPGWSTADEVGLLHHHGVDLEPDLVVIGFFLDDAGQGSGSPFAPTARRDLSSWRRHSWLLDHLAARIERRGGVERLTEDYRANYVDAAAGWQRARHALREARDLARERGFELVLMIFPVFWELSGDYPFRDIHETIRRAGEGLGVPVLDLLPEFAGFEGPELWVHPNNQHPNERAHAVAGHALGRFLVERGVIAGTAG